MLGEKKRGLHVFLATMALHSISEGAGVGVAYARSAGEESGVRRGAPMAPSARRAAAHVPRRVARRRRDRRSSVRLYMPCERFPEVGERQTRRSVRESVVRTGPGAVRSNVRLKRYEEEGARVR